MMFGFRGGVTVAAAALAVGLGAAPASGSTLNEADMPGGAFGGAWNAPTAVDPGITDIVGTGSQNRYDNFVFGLPSGAQTISLTFTAPQDIGWSYAAGGSILYGTTPFRWGWDGTTLGTVHTDYHTRSQSFTLDLQPDFGGSLWLALNFTYGSNLAYAIGIPSNAAPVNDEGTVTIGPEPEALVPVPLPAGGLLLATALAGFALAARRRLAA